MPFAVKVHPQPSAVSPIQDVKGPGSRVSSNSSENQNGRGKLHPSHRDGLRWRDRRALSAKRVGSNGNVYGLDMTDEMLALANENKRKAGADNVEFLKGEIESIPLPDDSVDVIISNCVINLSADKDRVLREAFRVLKPGGRIAVSDVVTRGTIPHEIRQKVLLWVGCIAGALDETDYRSKLKAAGFENVEVEPTRVYKVDDAREFLSSAGIDADRIAAQVDEKFMSAFVRAVKPANATTKACCGPTCCN